MKYFPIKTFFLSFAFGASALFGSNIQIQNRILTQVGHQTITVLDVKKEMDRQIYRKDPKLFDSPEATCSYYYQNWKSTLQKITQDEIFLLEAEQMKYEIPSHEITQKVTYLFGDNECEAYRFLSITPEEATASAKREIYSGHLSWFKIWAQTLSEATPNAILEAYNSYAENLSRQDSWTYQALYVSGKEKGLVDEAAQKITSLLKESHSCNLSAIVDQIHSPSQEVFVSLSKDITLKTHELSPSLLDTLASLEEGMASSPICGSKGATFNAKILQLKEHKKQEIPPLATVSEELKNAIVSSLGDKHTREYFAPLYKEYDVQGLFGEELLTSKLEPFLLVNE